MLRYAPPFSPFHSSKKDIQSMPMQTHLELWANVLPAMRMIGWELQEYTSFLPSLLFATSWETGGTLLVPWNCCLTLTSESHHQSNYYICVIDPRLSLSLSLYKGISPPMGSLLVAMLLPLTVVPFFLVNLSNNPPTWSSKRVVLVVVVVHFFFLKKKCYKWSLIDVNE